jgi:predicted DsbA family dithiol-disulfide isomerase
VQVEIWSDVVCPWCYIGKRRFEAALDRFAGGEEVEVVYRAFQLDPTAPPGVTMPVAEAYARKFGGPERAAEMIANITGLAEAEGLQFHLERALRANTLLAHRLLWFAEQRGVQEATKEALLRAYFSEGRNVADPDELAELAGGVGLDRDEVRRFLDSDEGLGEVMEQMAMAASAGITAVPTYVFDGKWAVPGAQDPDTFLRVLTRVAQLEREEAQATPAPDDGTDPGAVCEDDVCAT